MMTEAEYPICVTSNRQLVFDLVSAKILDKARWVSMWVFGTSPDVPPVRRTVTNSQYMKRRVYKRNDAPGYWVITPENTWVGFDDVDSAVMTLRLLHSLC